MRLKILSFISSLMISYEFIYILHINEYYYLKKKDILVIYIYMQRLLQKRQRTYLKVAYQDKDKGKEVGLRWDPEYKSWYGYNDVEYEWPKNDDMQKIYEERCCV